jgi:hypothetical protein
MPLKIKRAYSVAFSSQVTDPVTQYLIEITFLGYGQKPIRGNMNSVKNVGWLLGLILIATVSLVDDALTLAISKLMRTRKSRPKPSTST